MRGAMCVQDIDQCIRIDSQDILACACAVVCAATVGVVTERNAEKAIEELKAYEVRVSTGIHTSMHARNGYCPIVIGLGVLGQAAGLGGLEGVVVVVGDWCECRGWVSEERGGEADWGTCGVGRKGRGQEAGATYEGGCVLQARQEAGLWRGKPVHVFWKRMCSGQARRKMRSIGATGWGLAGRDQVLS
jgi:hypothetical protein